MESIHSAVWYRVAALKPALRPHVRLHRHRYRGERWYVLQDEATGQFYRFSPQAYQLIGLMNGERTLQALWEAACMRLGDAMPSQDEVIRLLSQLFEANAVTTDVVPQIASLRERQRTMRRRELLQRFKSPLAIRLPLLDPDRWIGATAPVVAALFTRWAALGWLLTVAIAGVLAAVHWPALTLDVADRVLALENVLVIALVYPVVKTLHELGHAYAVKRWGGEVHEIGIMLLVFFPVPYVDASAASAFANKWQRMLVGGAGIIVELFIAAVAMIAWTFMEPGLARSVAFNTMLIAGVSTVFFNGNPLLRFDAYYVLADFLELPNLASRATKYLGFLIKRYLFGVESLRDSATSWRERAWLVTYAIASFCYRLMIMALITLVVISKFFFIGVLLAMWSAYVTLIGPTLRTMSKPVTDPDLRRQPLRTGAVLAGAAALLVLALAVVPMPYMTYVQGVALPQQGAQVRAEADGFLVQAPPAAAIDVQAGEVLARFDDPALEARVLALAAQVKEARAQLAAADDQVEAGLRREILALHEAELAQAQQRQAQLTVSSSQAGTFVPSDPDAHLPGRFLARGALLGYVVQQDRLPTTALVSEMDIDAVRHRTREIEVRLASRSERSLKARVRRIVPASTQALPSLVLAVEGGGQVALDPEATDQPRTFQPHFHVILDVDDAPATMLNERVHVLFRHEHEPLLGRLSRAVRRVFLRWVDV